MIEDFDPARYLIQLKGKDYLEVRWRLVWLRSVHPDAVIHTDMVSKLGWMEGVFNTPSAHRVHHAANVEYLDCNYGGTIMLFDRLFGTYVEEKDGVPIRYGLVKSQTSRNALWVLLAEWVAIGRDLLKVRNPLHALGYLFGPPGWAPNGRGLTTEGLREKMTELTGRAAGVPPEWLIDGQPGPGADTISATRAQQGPRRTGRDVEDARLRA